MATRYCCRVAIGVGGAQGTRPAGAPPGDAAGRQPAVLRRRQAIRRAGGRRQQRRDPDPGVPRRPARDRAGVAGGREARHDRPVHGQHRLGRPLPAQAGGARAPLSLARHRPHAGGGARPDRPGTVRRARDCSRHSNPGHGLGVRPASPHHCQDPRQVAGRHGRPQDPCPADQDLPRHDHGDGRDADADGFQGGLHLAADRRHRRAGKPGQCPGDAASSTKSRTI